MNGRTFLRVVLLLLLPVACAARGPMTPDPQASRVSSVPGDVVAAEAVQPVFVGTTRVVDPVSGKFTRQRSDALSFARFEVVAPATGDGKAGPAPEVRTRAAVMFADASAFRADLKRALAAAAPVRAQDAVIFVHGYNTDFRAGLQRFVQVAHDLQLPGVRVHYPWPSAGHLTSYSYDRDSARFARDGLESLITEVMDAGAGRILLVAHSMGADLLMEVLRQAAIRGDGRLRAHLAGVVLISPDIDVDVFRAQAKAIGQLPEPFVILGSERDMLLAFSAGLTGQDRRLGNLVGIGRLADLDLTYLDVTAFIVGAGHSPLTGSPALIKLLSRMGDLDTAVSPTGGIGSGGVVKVNNATRIVLRPAVKSQEVVRPERG